MLNSAAKASIDVLIVEDDAITRSMLAAAIATEPHLKLVAALGSVKEAQDWLATGRADMLLTDIGLPDGSGIGVIRTCLQRNPDCDVMVITMSSDEESVLACIEAGAAEYVLKGTGGIDIVRSLMELHAGGSPISPVVARKVLARLRSGKSGPAMVPQTPALTRRESDILCLIARGDSYDAMARELCVSVSTVQTHVKNLYGKLSVHSRGEAVFEANRRGLLQMHALKARC
ncbi:response regulator [Noviherbaspirillum pedocola]|uniref:Response regulator transcription factor n=1 Tax=Noviherbaspirillum pedocola TaxID=2801341 RepID=A0A934SQS2_9BURK|nr:response regulator transcription factor [Noviherbaspirillum pedocola]MBK4733775.1 response regulator transcription factor [Noviherbaspirillum pedocola]